MRRWISVFCMLFAAILCHGAIEILGQNLAGDLDNATQEVRKYYGENGRSLLKIYDNGTWRNLTDADVTAANSAGKTTYVISHGLNASCNVNWITDSASAIQDNNQNAVIISVNWDHFSGYNNNPDKVKGGNANNEERNKNSNFLASTWINPVSTVLAEELGKFEHIKSFVGHSYGTHLLAETMVKMDNDGNLSKNEPTISFVALDPAEEDATFTGKSKDWGLPDKVISETYKSSGFLGAEALLGKYNYFLAEEATVTPRGVLGDLDPNVTVGDPTHNHSLAPNWFADMMGNVSKGMQLGGYEDSELIGGWFNSEVINSTETSWDGVVNATSTVRLNDDGRATNPELEYNASTDANKKPIKTWQDLCDAEARDRLEKGLEWKDTVLKPYKKSGYEARENVLNIFSRTKTTQDSFVDMSGSGVLQYGNALQAGDGGAPANILNTAFADGLAEPKDAQTLANEAFDKEIDKIIRDVADGEESLAQKLKDFVKGKIDEAIKKGEDWIENGGIRKTILEQVDKMIEGKVSSEDAQRIHTLVDTLCNVNKDGGESFCNTLGTDGKDLAVSLAVEALKKQFSDALPEDAAGMVNAMLDVLKDKGTADDYKKAVLGQIQSLITKYVPYENTANTLNGIIQDISEGNAIDVMDSIKGVGKNLGVDLLKDTISKNLDPELADRINALLDGFAKDGVQGVTDAALSQIYGLIDKYAPGKDSAQKLKDLIKGTLDGTVTAPDFKNTATTIVADGARNLINNSNLPQGVKDAANVAVDGLMQNGLTGLTTNVRDFISDYVSDYLGDDAAGEAVGKIFDAVVAPGVDPWQEILAQAPVIGAAVAEKCLLEAKELAARQIDKLIAKYPGVKKVLDKLGINGAGVIQGFVNVLGVLISAPSLSDAISTLSSMAAAYLKGIAAKLIDWALEWAVGWLNNTLMPKVLAWASDTLGKWADSVDNKLIKQGLEWLQKQCERCKKQGGIKIKTAGTGTKVINYVEDLIKKRSQKQAGTTVLERK